MGGRYDTLVTIQRATQGRDDIGGMSRTWATLDTVWADVDDRGGRELVQARQVRPEVIAVVTLRHAPEGATVTASDRVTFNGRTLNIDTVLGLDDRVAGRGPILHCVEGRAA